MADTNSQGAQYRPIKINYGSIVQNHIRYMNKYKSDEEAKKFSQKQKEDEFLRKIKGDRKKDLTKYEMGVLEGLYADGIMGMFEKERHEMSKLKQKYVQDGDLTTLNKINKRNKEYKIASNLPKEFTEYSKSLAKDTKEGRYNKWLDEGEKEFAKTLFNHEYKVVNRGLLIPAKDGILDKFQLKKSDADKDGMVTVSYTEISNALRERRGYSGSAKFKETGIQIGEDINYNKYDGNLGIDPKDVLRVERESIDRWKHELLTDEIKYRSALKKYGVMEKLDENGDLDDDVINILAINLNDEFTKRQSVDNSLNNIKKKASINASRRSGRTKQDKTPDNDLKIIVTGARKKDNSYLQSIVSPEGQVGTSGSVTMAEYDKDKDGNDVISLIWKKSGVSTNVIIRLDDPAFDMKFASYLEPKLSVPALRKKLNEGSAEGVSYTSSEIQSGGKINELKIKSFVEKFIKGDENAEGNDKEPFGKLDQTPAKIRMDKLTDGRVKVEDNKYSFTGFSYEFPNGVKIKSIPKNEQEIRKELTKLLSEELDKQPNTAKPKRKVVELDENNMPIYENQ